MAPAVAVDPGLQVGVAHELGPAVRENRPEERLELLLSAEHLDPVEGLFHAACRLGRQQDHDLEADPPEVEREDGLHAASGGHDAVHLDRGPLLLDRKRREVLVRPPEQVRFERDACFSLPSRTVLDLLREIEVYDVQYPQIHVPVEGPVGHGHLQIVLLPDVLKTLPFPEQRLHDLAHGTKLLLGAVYP